jgi:hypothetical protein
MSLNQREIARMSHCWLADGTFKTCPAPFSRINGSKGQLYTLFAELETGSLLPVGFAILPDKSSVSYAPLWKETHKTLTHDGKTQLGLETIGMDFENAPKTQFDLVFPDVQMSGCFFHYRQCLVRQLGKKSCLKFYNQSILIQELVLKFIALAHVPPDSIFGYVQIIEGLLDKIEEDLTPEAED